MSERPPERDQELQEASQKTKARFDFVAGELAQGGVDSGFGGLLRAYDLPDGRKLNVMWEPFHPSGKNPVEEPASATMVDFKKKLRKGTYLETMYALEGNEMLHYRSETLDTRGKKPGSDDSKLNPTDRLTADYDDDQKKRRSPLAKVTEAELKVVIAIMEQALAKRRREEAE